VAIVPLLAKEDGYWFLELAGVSAGSRYFVSVDGKDRPDPTSRSQPDGVHGASEILDETFPWSDVGWRGRPLAEMVIYELHVGTFTSAGTFEAIIEHLDELAALGVNTIEIMPISQFPGERNWGYDGVLPFAAQNSYGGRRGFKELVDACHAKNFSVLLDVVYNHFGPEGNYLADFGPYFTNRYRTPWGDAINFDGRGSKHVRRYFLENALQWVQECHVDGFRLDAVHAIFDNSTLHFLEELSSTVHQVAQELDRTVVLVAETNRNDPRIVTAVNDGGLGLDGQWPDDFSRSVQGLLTGDRFGYYADFGSVTHISKAYRQAFVLTGEHSVYRGDLHGHSAAHLPADRFVVCVQNHDQVGNRAGSDRLSQLTDLDSLKLAAATVILSPYVPLLFMGEEYGEPAPFHYFIDHSERALCKAVHRGRIAEFARHAWQETPPHPKARRTFDACKLTHALKQEDRHVAIWQYYRHLLGLRQTYAAIREPRRDHSHVDCEEAHGLLVAHRWCEQDEIALLLNFGNHPVDVALPRGRHPGSWRLVFRSAAGDERTIPRRSVALYVMERG
jgi:maltooligosyltrehalose trehalohydrolase